MYYNSADVREDNHRYNRIALLSRLMSRTPASVSASFSAFAISTQLNPEDRTALLHFKTQLITIDNPFSEFYDEDVCPHGYPKMSTWDNGTDCCSWMSVTCDSVTGHVIGLDLSCSGLVGNIHPNSTLFHLIHLQTLNLARSDFYGSELPSQFGELVSLTHLNLSYCEFEGDIPSQISHLSKLQSLDLSFNDGLSWKESTWKRMLQNATALREIVSDGTIMSKIKSPLSLIANMSSSLVTLSLAQSEIRGSLTNDILCSFPNLQKLNLANNQDMLIRLSKLSCTTSLSILDLSYCVIQGSIFSSFSNLTYLTSLILKGNDLNGSIPLSLSNLHHLTHLDLSGNNLSGQIPNVFESLTNLQTLSLRGNNFQGKLPSSLFTLTQLSQLDCSSNKFEGPLSDKAAFSNLTKLFLQDNLLNGTIPWWVLSFKSMRSLDLSNNRFVGHTIGVILSTFHSFLSFTNWYIFPSQVNFHGINLFSLILVSTQWLMTFLPFFCNTTSLFDINLSHNNFTGTFPKCLSNSSHNTLDIQMNKFHGTLPDTFPRDLKAVNVNGNRFEGLLPKTLSNCTGLVDLNLGNNQFEDIFPNWLQNLTELEILVLQGNKLYGPIAELKSENIFPRLIIFDISCNNFSGSLPKVYIKSFQAMKILGDKVHDLNYYIETGGTVGDGEDIEVQGYDDSVTATIKGANTPFAKIPTVFVNIDLSENKFEGDIPDIIGELQGLRDLNLSHNRLVGHIPHSLGNLTNLESLDLSSNMLTGKIPSELTNLNFLEALNLSQNQLVGSIPEGKQFDTFLNDSYLGNMGLCGLPLSLQCNNNVPQPQYQSSEGEDKFGFGWKPVAIGYACGMVFGIGLGWFVFWLGKPQWLVIIFDGKWIKRRARITLFSFGL
ncbi:hypothetical protein PIB30_050690 [Stylosanthes scabra]|uniref:Leucine-rich repeat-containing N-terminal plant-type domain-containing protein n=1 Tax=Stylosanthes scabra TaxID=79078 RepID=A0ABU6SI62_9FABA|nr:hypothetical protein [Stylosanthes scabra]